MNIFQKMAERGHEELIFCSDDEIGLQAIIAIHNTVLGPALGGCRMYPYKTFEDALCDAVRLARGMTYKASVAGLNLGGGKSVIIFDPKVIKNDPVKRELLFRSFGRFVQGLGGRYITAEDVGTSVEDMEFVNMETDYVTGIPLALGGSGDPSPVTAYGVYCGMLACVEKVFGNASLKDRSVLIQGVGHVGKCLVDFLNKDKAKVFIFDPDKEKVNCVLEQYKNTESVEQDDIYGLDVDIYAPCALGATINDNTIDQFKFKIIAGCANNQLEVEEKHGRLLLEKGIIYAPDFVINSGGLINVYSELEGYNRERAMGKAGGIRDVVAKVLDIAEKENIPSYLAANKLAEERIAAIRNTKKFTIK